MEASRAGLPLGGPERTLRVLDRVVLLARYRRSFAKHPASLLRLLEQLFQPPRRFGRVPVRVGGLPLSLGKGRPRSLHAFLTSGALRLARAAPLLGLRSSR